MKTNNAPKIPLKDREWIRKLQQRTVDYALRAMRLDPRAIAKSKLVQS